MLRNQKGRGSRPGFLKLLRSDYEGGGALWYSIGEWLPPSKIGGESGLGNGKWGMANGEREMGFEFV